MTKDKSIVIRNIYYMLAYAFQSLQQDGYKDIHTEKFENIHTLFAAILSMGISRQIKQGLYRSYVEQRETGSSLRGKIVMRDTMKNCLEGKRVLTYDQDVFSVNNILNQIVKTTVCLLLRLGEVEQEYKQVLKKEMLLFSEVNTIPVKAIPWSTLTFHRNNQTYAMLIQICHLLIDGFLLTTEEGNYHLASFLQPKEMSRLYEKFLLGYFQQEWPEVTAEASLIQWQVDDGNRKDLPEMKTDVTLSTDKQVLIIDAKFYEKTMQSHYGVYKAHSAHLYQIFSYVKNKEASLAAKSKKVSGMLLYAATDEERQPDGCYQMSGNQICVKTLDLNQEFDKIRKALNDIVKEHFPEVVK